ncbi:hypothetical protein CYY_002608 [Polysphondylium violaceum]|uniref:Uncharacterized protein n=1 Tax=Polysphondylium violaceum TaxID=133409 RepID=A0A8J4V9G9_9MYCE|nr:hypothetical protein CYY_002608 [Polysphondylium violaceum]
MKFIITLLVFLSIASIGYTRADHNIVIWNSGGVSIGTIDFASERQAFVQWHLPGFLYPNPPYQASTYNYVTKLLTMYVYEMSTKIPYLFVVDCDSWTTLAHQTFYNSAYMYGGLASPNTAASPPTVFSANSLLESKKIFVSRIENWINIVTFDTVIGSYRGSVFDSSIGYNSYYLAFTNQTGLYVRAYYNSQLTREEAFGFSNNLYPVNDEPLNLVYDATTKNVWAQVSMTNPKDGYIYYALAFLDWNKGVFRVSDMYGNAKDRFSATLPNPNGSNFAYSFGVWGGYLTLYTFNTSSESLISDQDLSTPIANAF